jgi:hypothetical protein
MSELQGRRNLSLVGKIGANMEKVKTEQMPPKRLVAHFQEWKWWYFVLFLVVASIVSNSLFETVWRKPPGRGWVASVTLELPKRVGCHLRDVVHLRWEWNSRSESDASHTGTENWQIVNIGPKRVLWLMDTPLGPSETHAPSFCVLVTRGKDGTVVIYPENMHPVIKVPSSADYNLASTIPGRSSLVELLLRPRSGIPRSSPTLPH